MPSSAPRPMSRRSLLTGALAAGGTLAVPGLVTAGTAAAAERGATALVRRGRPALTHGVQSGDVGRSAATVWARSDRQARMLVEVSRDPSFHHARTVRGAVMTPESDFTGKTLLRGLPPGTDLHYRVTPVDLDDHDRTGEPVTGHLRTSPVRRGDVSFVWGGDIAGQGWGIDTERGGYRVFTTMRDLDPDFYVCNGDNVYADGPLEEEVTLPDGSTWRNLVTEEKSKVAETLDEYRGQYKYNLIDENLRAFYATVPQIQQWDDHETLNNWYPGETIDDPRYTVRDVDVLARRASQAWHEYAPIAAKHDDALHPAPPNPPRGSGRKYRVVHHGPLLDVFVLDMRWYKDPNSANKQAFNNGGVLGHEQAAWLRRELLASKATWKVIANDLPLGMVVTDGADFESVSQGHAGRPLGREIQIAELLSALKQHGVRNVVWLTADVHFTAAHYFDPGEATFQDFDPFWQFVTGPLHAGSFPSIELDPTFGCQQVFVKAPQEPNMSPATEYQFFGQVSIDEGGRFTVRLRDNEARVLWQKTLHPHER